jgi:cytochrome c2
MIKKKIKNTLGATLVAFCLLFISNYIGNTLVPPLITTDDISQSTNHDWIQWPEPKNAAVKTTNSIKETIGTTQTTSTMILDNKGVTKLINLEKNSSKSRIPLTKSLLTSNSTRGGKIARKCIACHSFKKGGKNKIGPNLYGILGQDRGTVKGFKYSTAIKKKGGKWDFNDMDTFLLKPAKFVPGTKMSFRGIKNINDRAAIIMYMRSFAESALPLP